MDETSTNLNLPYLQAAQAQKHVTHNAALERLDHVVQLVLQGTGETTPPVAPDEGQIWAVGTGAINDWVGHDGALAAWSNGGWLFMTPRAGWRGTLGTAPLVFDGEDWVTPDLPALQNLPGVGVNASYDGSNRLAVASAATLLTHEGAGHQLKINKNASGDTASVLFQSGWSGRAEMGTMGSDGFGVKVSSNGATWTTALAVNAASGVVTLGQGAVLAAPVSGTAVTQSAMDTTAGRLLKVGDFGVGVTIALTGSSNLNDLSASGFYYNPTSGNTAGNNYPISSAGALVHIQRTDGSVQTFIAYSSGRHFERAQGSGGAWGAWREVYQQGNVLGTVSQASGVPTGAVIERGSNANGEYVRFADGTQICWSAALTGGGNASTAVGNVYRTGDMTWTYPAAFSAEPRLSANCRSEINHFATIRPNGSGNTTSAIIRGWAGASQANAWEYAAIAIGRWF